MTQVKHPILLPDDVAFIGRVVQDMNATHASTSFKFRWVNNTSTHLWELSFKPIGSLENTQEFLWSIRSQNEGETITPRLVSRIETLTFTPGQSHPPPTLEFIANLDSIVATCLRGLGCLELLFYRDSLKSIRDRSVYFNMILDMPLMGFSSIKFTMDGERVSYITMQGVAKNMDREDGEDFDLTSQTTQPHNIVGSQMPTTEIKDVRYTDDPSMYWNDEVNEGKLAFGEPEEETQHQDRREETQHQDRRTLRRSLEHWKQWHYIVNQWRAENHTRSMNEGFKYYRSLSESQREALHKEAAEAVRL
ncbi:hypothetical protein NLI96_g823 [Meripilus lineatus]|uniref:Uncharacterized protein n=1 Tax=Meripilus lineatus TaxID=2056292 RepID=A0AAD5VH82_9APHY|nr:hypothetical protein NLI96_g823 [Physisporinus lineatus]